VAGTTPAPKNTFLATPKNSFLSSVYSCNYIRICTDNSFGSKRKILFCKIKISRPLESGASVTPFPSEIRSYCNIFGDLEQAFVETHLAPDDLICSRSMPTFSW
jgi:hypothetical protein